MTIKTEYEKFATYLRTLELKFFKGKLHQRATAPNPGQQPAEVWLPVDSHDQEAPAPGETLQTGTATSTSTSTGTEPLPPGGLHPGAGATYDPPAGLVATGNAQGDPAKATPVRYGDDGEIPPVAPQKAPQPADVAAVKDNPAAPPPKSAT